MQRSVLTTEMGNVLGGVNATRFPTWLNQSISRVCAMRIWSFLLARQTIVLVAAQQGYPLAAGTVSLPDFGGVLDVALIMTSGTHGIPICGTDSPQTFDKMTRHNIVAGTPMLYTITASSPANTTPANVKPGGQLELRLSPIPSAVAGQGVALDVLYKRTTESLKPTSDSHELIGPEEFGWACFQYALGLGFASVGNLPNAQYWQSQAVQSVQALVTQDEAILPIRDSQRISMAAPPNITGPAAGQISAADLPLPVARQGAA